MLLAKRMLSRLLDVNVWSGEGGGMYDQFFCGSLAEMGGWIEDCREDGGCKKCVEGE